MADIQGMANAIRFLAIDAILNAGEGHQGVPLGMAEIAATLYCNHLKVDPADPKWPDRDRVVLSNGHGSMLLYSLLHLSGYDKVSIEALKTFRRLGSVCAGHPEIEQDAGIEITTGLLGQGIACAVGMAVAEQKLAAEFGPDLVNHRTWAFVGDGCLMEGVGHEAISVAGHQRLGGLTFFWDDNGITDDGSTSLSISEDVRARFRAAGWHVVDADGHDIDDIDKAIIAAKADPRPSLIACRTVIARGIPRLQGQRGGHSAPLTMQDREAAAELMKWPHAPFAVPRGVVEDYERAMRRGAEERAKWAVRLQGSRLGPAFERRFAEHLPKDCGALLADLNKAASSKPRPTILSSGDMCEAIEDILPELLVLCADLEAPTNHKRGRAAFTPENRSGTYVHCGVREHAMGAMACGIAAHGGLCAVNVTYLAFADYERPAMRMAALMELPAIFVFSHDSIGVGSNGPTHQPVEILASFRAMPNFNVFRPADAIETAESWEIALEQKRTPSLMALSRQDAIPVRAAEPVNLCRNGAYVIRECRGARDVTLIASGTEVALAISARKELEKDGFSVAVVSMPCWELFDNQPEDYREATLGSAPRIAIEAAMKFGWERWLRPGDRFIGMNGFGASDRSDTLYRHFGITVEAIIKASRDVVGRPGA